MAPVCVASCLSSVFLSTTLMLFLINTSSTLLSYDHQTLLEIGYLVSFSTDAKWSGSRTSPPPFSLNIPDFLCRLPFDFSLEEVLQEMREAGRSCHQSKVQSALWSLDFSSPVFGSVSDRHVAWCSLELPFRPIVLSFLDGPVHPVSPRICGGGVNHGVLCLLNRNHHLLLRMALINVRSLVNKTLTFCKTFCRISSLQITWIKEGDYSSFSELVPHDSTFYNFPRVTRHGGGLTAVFKCKYITCIIPADVNSSVEVQFALSSSMY